ncbi:alpha/beta hydrolase [Embleya sp. NPDC008237]|uniref:alpha/beta hydrolase n=1 Tax=Embleya sp. NPDC008237 TaxID=3363978 RepID=UPI0036F0AEAB
MDRDREDSAGGYPPARVVLDPAVRRLIAASATPPSLDDLDPITGRQALAEAQADRIEDFEVDAVFGAAPVGPSGLVGYWTIRPAGVSGPLPTLFYVHGGRWTLGDAHTHARLISGLVTGAGVAAIVPEYSRSPEARYPVALRECHALLAWAVDNADSLGLRPDRVAVAGDCAGATLATAVAMTAQAGGPAIDAQLLYYPLTDAACESDSQRRFAEGHLLTRKALLRYWQDYLGTPASAAPPTASPLSASSAELAGMPPTLVITAEADVCRDEGERYAERLREAGVAASAVRFLGTVHDFVSLNALRDSPPTRAAVAQGCAFLKARLA